MTTRHIKHLRFRLDCKLWSINRWLRYTGFRLHIGSTPDVRDGAEGDWTVIGFGFWGWSSMRGEGW